jgi:hypothetical protein
MELDAFSAKLNILVQDWILPLGAPLSVLGLYSKHFIFSELVNRLNKLVLHYTRLKMHVMDKHTSLLVPFVSYEEMKCCEYASCGLYCKHIMIVNDDSQVVCK